MMSHSKVAFYRKIFSFNEADETVSRTQKLSRNFNNLKARNFNYEKRKISLNFFQLFVH